MDNVLDSYLAAYRTALVKALIDHPSIARSSLLNRARLSANATVPEGHECLMTRIDATLRGKVELKPTYEYKVGEAINNGLRAINREVLGSKSNLVSIEEAARFNEDTAPRADPNHRNTPSAKTRADLIDRYCAWANAHKEIPPDLVLAHFTEWGTSTWRGVRAAAAERGYAFDVQRGHVLVTKVGGTSREDFEVVARIEKLGAELQDLLKRIGR